MGRMVIGLASASIIFGGVAGATEGAAQPDDLAALEARVHEIELQVAEAKALVDTTGGKAPKAPADLPARFKQSELQAALGAAFKQVKSGAQLTSVDCSEYPCIAVGTGLSTAQLPALKASPALQPYQRDQVSLFVWDNRVAVIATPKGDPALGGEGEQRILTRFHQMTTPESNKGS